MSVEFILYFTYNCDKDSIVVDFGGAAGVINAAQSENSSLLAQL